MSPLFNLSEYVLGGRGTKIALGIISTLRYEKYTYSDILNIISNLQTILTSHNLGKHDKIVMRLGNTLSFPMTYLAAISLGAIPVPTSPALTDREFKKILYDISPKLIVRDPDLRLPQTDIATLEATCSTDPAPPPRFDRGDPNRLAYIVYTSGTSGAPTPVMHAHRAILARRMMWDGWYDLQKSDRVLHAGAFNWTFTLGTGLLDPWSIGATSFVLGSDTEIKDIPALLRKYDISIFAAAPGVYRKLLSLDLDLSNLPLRHGLCAGEMLSDDLRRAWQAATGCDLHQAFGMSECSTFISGAPKAPARMGTLGRPQQGRKVAIIGPDGPVPTGETGQIAIHKSDLGLMLGYYNDPVATAAKYQGEWFLTGDLGAMAQDGSITYLGRNDDMMNAGGFRVSPLEVEDVLRSHPAIHQVAVTDVEVKKDTRVIAAFYTADHDIDPQELNRFAKSQLARYKEPRLYIRLSELPTNANGKLSRSLLRQAFEARNERKT